MKITTATVFFSLGLFFGSLITALSLDLQRTTSRTPQAVNTAVPAMPLLPLSK